MVGSGSKPFTQLQIAHIKSTFGEDIEIAEDSRTIKLPVASMWKTGEIENLFKQTAGSIAALGGVQVGSNMQSFRDALRNPRGGDLVGSFDFGPQGAMDKYSGKPLKDGIPSDLLGKAEEMGKQIIKIVDVTKIKELQGADILTGGKPDPKKVGGILLAAASFQEIYNKTDGPFVFDNKLTFTDLDRLNDPQLRKFILDQGKEISGSMTKVRTSSVDQSYDQILKDSGFHDKTAFKSDHLPAVNVAQKSGNIQIT